MQGVIYRDGSIVGDTQSDVLYFDDPQEYYDIPLEVRQSLGKLVVLNTDGDNISADNIYYDDELSVKDKFDQIDEKVQPKQFIVTRVNGYTNKTETDFTVPEGYTPILATSGFAQGTVAARTKLYHLILTKARDGGGTIQHMWDGVNDPNCWNVFFILSVRTNRWIS